MMEELKPAEILKAVHTCGTSFCTTDHHECPYGDDGCIDCVDRLEADFEALIAAGDDLVIRRAAPENKALTLDELKKMDGEPVWIEFKNRNSKTGKFVGWAIMDSNYDYLPFMGDELRPKFEWYGRSWLAYARKPEGSET